MIADSVAADLIVRLSDALLGEPSFSKRFLAWDAVVRPGAAIVTPTQRAESIAEQVVTETDAAVSEWSHTHAILDASWIEPISWVFQSILFRESHCGPALAADGSGDNGNGWDEPQIDIHAHPQLVQILRGMPFGSTERRRRAIEFGIWIFLNEGLTAYPTHAMAAVCKYNASKSNVDRGIREGDPNAHTTGGDYGKDVLAHVDAWTKTNGLWMKLSTLADTLPN